MNGVSLPKIERNLFLPALAGFFVAGVWLAPNVSVGLWPLWLLALALLLIFPLRMLNLPLRLAALPLALMFALLWTQVWLHPAVPEEGRYAVTATVYGDSKVSDAGNVTFTLSRVSLDGEAQPGKAYAISYTDEGDEPLQLTDGMEISFSGKVYHPYGKENEYDFDFAMWLKQHGIGYAVNGIKDLQVISGNTSWTNFAQRIADACHERLAAVMGEDADLAVAMLLGQRGAITQDDTVAFQRAGVAHIMAVSGLHVGILSAALLWLLERLRLRKKLQIPAVALFLLLYCGVTGFSVSSLRAGVMVLLLVIARAYGRKTNPVTILSTALLIVLIINPLQWFSAGFVLSFTAVGGIALLYPRFLQGLDRLLPNVKVKKERFVRYRLQRFLQNGKQALAVTLAAELGVLLPIAVYYHHVYPYSLLFNLVIVPMVGVLVPLYAVTALTLFIPWIGGFLGIGLGFAAKIGSEILLRLVRVSNTLPLAELRVALPSAWICIAAFACALIVSHFVRASVRRRLLAIAAVVVIAAAGSFATRAPSVRYHQFAVGSADSALIVDGDVTIGIDTGNDGGAMIDRLLAEGRDLDVLILTHLHLDHVGGVDELLDEGIRIGQVYLPVDYERQDYGAESLAVVDLLTEAGIPVKTLAAGDTLRFHETTIDVLWPQAGRTRLESDPNDRSLAMLITLDGVRILNMADNSSLYERYAAVSADILKVAHHGSKSSSGEEFLALVDPALALVTTQTNTTLPALERIEAQGAQVLRTDETGEITIVPTQTGYRAYRFLSEETH
jgi:competence protein ComEC